MKTILIILFFMQCIILCAQTQKGSWMVGGNAYARVETKYERTFATFLNPSVGYFIGNNVALGLAFPFQYSSRKSSPSNVNIAIINGKEVNISKSINATFAIGPFLRVYMGSGKFKPFVFAQVGLGRNSHKTKYENNPATTYSNASAFVSGGPGISYFISENVGIEAIIQGTYNPDYTLTIAPTSIGLYLGFQFYLPKNEN